MTFEPFTEEVKRQAKPYGVKILIKATKDQIRNGRYRNDMDDLYEDLRYLEDLLKEAEGRTQA